MKRLFWIVLAAVACGGAAPSHSRYPAQPAGCSVIEVLDLSTTPLHNIGRVSSICGRSVPEADCKRTLEDEVCKLGGDAVWGIETKEIDPDHVQMSARASHTK